MIGVDTNILLRLLVSDDAAQGEIVRRFMMQRSAEDPIYIGSVVLAETIWVLLRKLEYPRDQILDMVRMLVNTAGVVVEHAEALEALLDTPLRTIADIPDYLVVWSASRAGCSTTVTFDKKAASRVPGMELLA
jgi:predicted nucleic-acid-binding protein